MSKNYLKSKTIILITICLIVVTGFVLLNTKTIEQFNNLTTGDADEVTEETPKDKPIFLSASIEPKKVAPGDNVIVTVEIKDDYGITEVKADMGGIANIVLDLIEGNTKQGVWQGNWLAHDTKPQNYQTMVYATNAIGKQSSISINWEDPTITDTFTDETKIASKTNITISGGQAKLTSCEITDDFSPSADSYVDSSYATTNYGSATGLKIQFPSATSEALVKFDLSSISGKDVTNADLCLYFYSHSIWLNNVQAFRILEDWAENSVTWNTKPFYAAPATNSSVVLPVGAYRCFDITSDVQGWCNGTYTNYGTALTYGGTGSGGRYIWAYSKEYTGNDYDPYLRVTYNNSGTLTSTNLLDGQGVLSIDSFVYNLSTKPSGSAATVQFSQDNTSWYNSSGNNPWDSGLYSYRKKITLQGQTGAGTNYPVKLLIGESSGASGEDFDLGAYVQSDFDDIRFTDNDEETLLDYWIESITGTTPNQLATVWVEVKDDLGSNVDIYIYYGNPFANSASSGQDTFLFFDDFNDGDYGVGPPWTVHTVTFSAVNKYLETTDSGEQSISTPSATAYGRWDMKFKHEINGSYNCLLRWYFMFKDNADPMNAAAKGYYFFSNTSGDYFKLIRDDGSSAVAIIDTTWEDDTNWHTVTVTRTSAGYFQLYLDGDLKGSVTDTTYTTSSYMGFSASAYDTSYNVAFDDIRVRKYVSADEPDFSSAGSEENVGADNLTTGTNNTIDLSGLAWSGPNFYYKVAFTSDGVDTPVLDDISVNYTSWTPRPPGIGPSGGGIMIF